MKWLLMLGAVFITGMILGATGVNVFYAKQLDKAIIERQALRLRLKEQELRLSKLEEQLAEKHRRIVKEIYAFPDSNDPHVRLRARELVHDLLNDIVGKEVEKIDPRLLYTVLDGRVIKVNSKQFTLDVELIVMAPSVEIFLKLVPENGGILEE